MIPDSTEISDEFLAQLKDDLIGRRLESAMARLASNGQLLAGFNSEQKNAAVFVGYMAQCVDSGFQRYSLVKEMVSRFSKTVRAHLPLRDFLLLRMAEGMVAMAEESK